MGGWAGKMVKNYILIVGRAFILTKVAGAGYNKHRKTNNNHPKP
jgi:hypothetical protein